MCGLFPSQCRGDARPVGAIPAQAKAFGEANGGLLKRIGAFNEAHLVDYVYMNAAAER